MAPLKELKGQLITVYTINKKVKILKKAQLKINNIREKFVLNKQSYLCVTRCSKCTICYRKLCSIIADVQDEESTKWWAYDLQNKRNRSLKKRKSVQS